MTLRAGHGRGRGVPRVEVLPPDELPPATPALAVRPDRDANGRFVGGNAVGQEKRLRAGNGGAAIDKGDELYRKLARWGRTYASHRRKELAHAHGGSISAGVGVILDSARLALVASRYLESKGAEKGDADLLKRASALACDARQHELAAWELAAREAKARALVEPQVNPFMNWEEPAKSEEPRAAEEGATDVR